MRNVLTTEQMAAGRLLADQAKTKQRKAREAQAKQLYAEGWSKGRIAKHLHVSARSVTNYLKSES